MPENQNEKNKMTEYLLDRLSQHLKRVCMKYVRGQTYQLGCQIVIAVNGQVGVDVYPDSIPSCEYQGDGSSRFMYISFDQQPYDDGGCLGCQCPVLVDGPFSEIQHSDACHQETAEKWAFELADLYEQGGNTLEAELGHWLASDCTASSLADLVAVNSASKALSL